MKLFIVLFALVAAVSAFPGYDDPWKGSSAWQPSSVWPSSGWQPQSAWPSSGWQPQSAWPSSGWQPHSAWPSSGWQPHAKPVIAVPHYPHQHHVEHVQVLHVAQPAAVPPLHPHPLKLSAHNHVVRIPLHANKVAHPHLIGVEHYHEPEIQIKPVHGHGHGW